MSLGVLVFMVSLLFFYINPCLIDLSHTSLKSRPLGMYTYRKYKLSDYYIYIFITCNGQRNSYYVFQLSQKCQGGNCFEYGTNIHLDSVPFANAIQQKELHSESRMNMKGQRSL